MAELDKLDLKILNILLAKGNIGYKEMAKEIGTTMGTVHNRIKALQAEKVLNGFKPVIDSKQLGFEISVIISITIKGGHLEDVEKKYARHKNVCCVYDTTGGFDSMIIAKFRKTSELNAFVKRLMAEDFVERTNTNLVLNIVKESSTPFPLD